MLPDRPVLVEEKSPENAQKWSNLASFWKPEVCCQTVLPDRSVLKGQKIGRKCQNWKNRNATFRVNFQAICIGDSNSIRMKMFNFRVKFKCISSISFLFLSFWSAIK